MRVGPFATTAPEACARRDKVRRRRADTAHKGLRATNRCWEGSVTTCTAAASGLPPLCPPFLLTPSPTKIAAPPRRTTSPPSSPSFLISPPFPPPHSPLAAQGDRRPPVGAAMGCTLRNRRHSASAARTIVVIVTIAVWAAAGGRAAADVVFFDSGKPGATKWSFFRRSIYFRDSSVRAGNRLLPVCSSSSTGISCCITLCRQTPTLVRVMSWGSAAPDLTNSRFTTTAQADRQCPLAFGTFGVDPTESTARIRSNDGTFPWGSRNTRALASCSTPGLSWATSTGSGGRMVWAPVNGRAAPKPAAPKPDPKPATGGLTPWQRKQLSHSVCVRGCGSRLTSRARPWPSCVGDRQRRQLSYAECTERCLLRL